MNNRICPIIFVTFAYEFHTLNVITFVRAVITQYYICLIIVVTCAYVFHALSVTTIMGQG